MKKITLLILVLIIALGGTACKKNIVEDHNQKQTSIQEEKNEFQFNDDGKIDRISLEKQISELLDDEFTIIYTSYKSVEEVNRSIKAPIAPSTTPYYELIAYNFEEDLGIKVWSWGNPENNILNYNITIANKEEYEIAREISESLKSKKEEYYYLIDRLYVNENYNGVIDEYGESSYYWVMDVIEKNDFSRNSVIEGYMDTIGNVKIIN